MPGANSEVVRASGELFWTRGEEAAPIRIQSGVVMYRVGRAGVGMLGPGSVATPVPGMGGVRSAASDLVALTPVSAERLTGAGANRLKAEELADSSNAVLEGASRLGNLSLAQRVAALLLDITRLTEHRVVPCRQDILGMASAGRRETVATILGEWRDMEILHTRYRRCIIVDRPALEQLRENPHAFDDPATRPVERW